MSALRSNLSLRLSACLWAAAAAPALLAAQPDDRANDPIVTVKTVTDDALIGRLLEFSLDGDLLIAADDRDRLLRYCTEDVVRVVTERRFRPAATDAARLELI
ncbi:MAG: hypothetical protein GY778_10510, partial [bacterium]|nr:hypothetical protein [bacterium]